MKHELRHDCAIMGCAVMSCAVMSCAMGCAVMSCKVGRSELRDRARGMVVEGARNGGRHHEAREVNGG